MLSREGGEKLSAPTSFYLGKRADLLEREALRAKAQGNFEKFIELRERSRKYRERAGQLEVELCEL